MNLLILGGNRYNILSIEEAKKHGFYTIVADKNPQAAGFSVADLALNVDILDSKEIIETLKRQSIKIDGVVSMAEVGVISASKIATHFDIPSIGTSAESVTSKALMRKHWLALNKQNTVGFNVVQSLEEALNVAKRIAFPVIFKPSKSFGGSRGVSKVEEFSIQKIKKAFDFAIDGSFRSNKVVIEEYVSGREFSAEVLIFNGEISVLCIGEKQKTPEPYRVDVSVNYPANLTEKQQNDVTKVCHKAVEALGLTWGVAHIEFCLTNDERIVLFELGARCGGGHTPLIAHHVSGVNEFIEYCNMACGKPPSNFYPKYQQGAIYRFLVFPSGKVSKASFPAKYENHLNVLDYELSLKENDVITSLKTTSDRKGFVIVLEKNQIQALDLAKQICKNVQVIYDDGKVSSALLP